MRRDYSLNQVEYGRNCIFRRNFPIHKLFERSGEWGWFCLTADQIAQIFGVRKDKRIRGKRHSMLEKLDCGRGPLANSLFPHRPEASAKPPAKIEVAYHKADAAIQKLIDPLAA